MILLNIVLNFKIIQTKRLSIEPINLKDAAFILELVNTSGWLKFIGNKNINNTIQAQTYINKIINNVDVTYWVAKLNNTNENIGLITIIKRDYLDYQDIGFAFLPRYCNLGYAFEATKAVLIYEVEVKKSHTILAITVLNNEKSIKLITKLGFLFYKNIEADKEHLLMYKAKTTELESVITI